MASGAGWGRGLRLPIAAATLSRYSASVSLSGTSGIDLSPVPPGTNGDFVVSFSIDVRWSPSFPSFLALFHIRKSEGFMHANFRRLRDGPNIYSASLLEDMSIRNCQSYLVFYCTEQPNTLVYIPASRNTYI